MHALLRRGKGSNAAILAPSRERGFRVMIVLMTKMELAIEALEALPAERREEIAEIVLELAEAARATESALTQEQWMEVESRLARGFRPADPDRIRQILARFA
jgi:LmbE family N-acetylglucosaminyl deacetylase